MAAFVAYSAPAPVEGRGVFLLATASRLIGHHLSGHVYWLQHVVTSMCKCLCKLCPLTKAGTLGIIGYVAIMPFDSSQ